MDLLQHMHTFVRIGDVGSISGAARDLRLSVAMASRQLRALEEHLGVELVRRTTRRLSLTEAGAEFLVRSRALIAAADEARAAVRPGGLAAGLVVVSMPVSFGLALVGPLFPMLLQRHPQLRLELRYEDRVVELLSDGVDLAVRAGVPPPDSPFVISRRLATMERVLCASPAFLEAHRVTSAESLSLVPCILQGAATHWRLYGADGPVDVEVSGRLRSNTVVAIRDAALAGTGVAQLAMWIVHDDLKQGRLVRVLPQHSLQSIEINGVYHRGARGSVAIKTILDCLQHELPLRLAGATAPAPRPRRR